MSRVLIVDDNPDVRESLGVVCDVWGYEVATAADGGEALALVAAFQPDVVLLDLGLPGELDGSEVARRIRDADDHRVFIVALTGWTQPKDRHNALRAGVDTIVLKPPDLEDLQRTMALALINQRSAPRRS
jgi:CheY-like chemotaxis protein